MTGRIVSLSTVFGLLAAAGEVEEASLAPWPHHAAIRELSEKAEPGSQISLALRNVVFQPSSDVGLLAPDVVRVMHGLLRTGVLVPEEEKPVRSLTFDAVWRARHRELLRALNPSDRRLLRQTGRRWAACCRTASNNSARGRASSC